MGPHLTALSESLISNEYNNMTGFRWFSKTMILLMSLVIRLAFINLKERCSFYWKKHFSYKYFPKFGLVRNISTKCLGHF